MRNSENVFLLSTLSRLLGAHWSLAIRMPCQWFSINARSCQKVGENLLLAVSSITFLPRSILCFSSHAFSVDPYPRESSLIILCTYVRLQFPLLVAFLFHFLFFSSRDCLSDFFWFYLWIDQIFLPIFLLLILLSQLLTCCIRWSQFLYLFSNRTAAPWTVLSFAPNQQLFLLRKEMKFSQNDLLSLLKKLFHF